MNSTSPKRSLAQVRIEDAKWAVAKLNHFIDLLGKHHDEPEMRDFLLGEVEAAAERVSEHISTIVDSTAIDSLTMRAQAAPEGDGPAIREVI